MGWTNNWRGLKNTMLLGAIKPGMNTLVTTSGTTVLEQPPDYSVRPISPMTAYSVSSVSLYNQILVGTGSATPTASDFKLDAPTTGISYLAIANEEIEYDVSNGTATKTVVMTVQNTTSSSITLREWGVFNRVSYSGTYTENIMLYRALFATAVTLAAYESATLTLTLTLTLNDPL